MPSPLSRAFGARVDHFALESLARPPVIAAVMNAVVCDSGARYEDLRRGAFKARRASLSLVGTIS